MQVQVNTDHHFEEFHAAVPHIKDVVKHALSHVSDNITRVEVHVHDLNGGKPGKDDKSCTIEARLAHHQPIAVTHRADTLHKSVDGAANKLLRALENTRGRLRDQQHRAKGLESLSLDEPD